MHSRIRKSNSTQKTEYDAYDLLINRDLFLRQIKSKQSICEGLTKNKAIGIQWLFIW